MTVEVRDADTTAPADGPKLPSRPLRGPLARQQRDFRAARCAMRLRGRAQRLIVVSPPDTPPRRVLEMTALYVNAPVADARESGLKLLGNTALP